MSRAAVFLFLSLAAVAFGLQSAAIDPETGLLVEDRLEEVLAGRKLPLDKKVSSLKEGVIAGTDAEWEEDVRLTANEIADYTFAYGRQLLATDPSGRVHVVWMSYQSPGTYSPQIYYKRYYPGSGWTNDTCISTDLASSGYSYYPALCVDSSGDVHVVWFFYRVSPLPKGYYIAYKKCTPTSSGNGGWEENSVRITEDTLRWYKFFPAIAATPNNRIHVVYYCYHSTLGYAIGYKEKVGTAWQPRVWVDSGGTNYYRWWPKVAGDRNNNVHVTWFGYGGGAPYQIGYRGRFDGTWGSVSQNISGGSQHQMHPAIAVNPLTNNVHIVWQGYPRDRRNYRIIHKERLGAGQGDTFQLIGDTVSEPNFSYDQFNPCLTFTSDGAGHCVWHGNNSPSPRYFQIRYNERTPDGVWQTPTNLTNVTTSDRSYPSINNGGNSSLPDHLHLIWHDYRDGNWELYYKHGKPPGWLDLALEQIDIPGAIHLVGEDVNPSVWVRNTGTGTISAFSVKLDIGIMYTSMVYVNQTLEPGERFNVTGFATWTPTAGGFYPVRCSVRLASDSNPENDRLTKTTLVGDFVEHFDLNDGDFYWTGAWGWGSPQPPRGTPPSAPNCWGNVLFDYYGNNAEDTLISYELTALQNNPVVMFMHWMQSESLADGGCVKYSTDGGSTWTLLYPDTSGGLRPYTALGAYSGSWDWEWARFRVPVTTNQRFLIAWRFFSDEENVGYGWLIDDVVGIGCRNLIDVGVSEILAPTGSIPYGIPVSPRVMVGNYGTGVQTFKTRFEIDTVYADTQVVTLRPGEFLPVEFTPWTPLVKGKLQTKAVTMLAGDVNPENDTLKDSIEVYLLDVQPTAIIKPRGYVDSGAVIEPEVMVKNNGTTPASFYVRLQIGSSYDEQRLVLNLQPDEERLVSGFGTWSADIPGTYPVRCSTRLADDMVPENNLITTTVRVVVLDVGPTQIVEPPAVVFEGATVRPATKVKNYSEAPADIAIAFLIQDRQGNLLYSATESLSLRPLQETTHTFSQTWQATTSGNYSAISYTIYDAENRHQNDTIIKPFEVRPEITHGWSEMAAVPDYVKDGGWLTYDYHNGLIYAARGYKSQDFYSYDPQINTWTKLPAWPEGEEGKPPYKGSAGCYGDGYIYAVKGNNTAGFWRYSIQESTWYQLSKILSGPSGKNPKGGTSVVYIVHNDTPYVYLLKGYKQDFMRYNTITDAWEVLVNAPAGSKPKWDKGSWLVYDGQNTIYAHKAKYHEFWRYNITTQEWSESSLRGMPLIGSSGRKKKSKDGGSAAYYNGYIYALKGGNTCEFWRYEIGADTWTELEPVPEIGSSGRKKRVKNGGSLVYYNEGIFYAFKGGKTTEFWRYIDTATAAASLPAPERSGVMGEKVVAERFGFGVVPNPLSRGYGVLSYSVPQSGEARLTVYDVTGRAVFEYGFVASGTGTRSLDLRSLSAGVYLVRFEAAGASASQKLIVE
ncbi:MAG: T9SS type A sorting domain-containing protein [candidate division WOR-3 bacterium]